METLGKKALFWNRQLEFLTQKRAYKHNLATKDPFDTLLQAFLIIK